MKRTKKEKELNKAKKSVIKNTSKIEQDDNLITPVDTTISAKSSSYIVSSLYLFSVALIILALAAIIGFVSHVYSYNFVQKSTERFGFRSDDFDEEIYFQEDIDVQGSGVDSDDVQYVSESNEHGSDEDEESQPYMSYANEHDIDDEAQLYVSDSNDVSETQVQNVMPEMAEKNYDAKSALYLEHRDLLLSYTFNFEKALKRRQEAMKKYSYPYSADGVDKRSNLSLQEYYDVYDGKWPVIITDVIPSWPASKWSEKTLKAKYGNARVTMMTYNLKDEPNFKGSKEGFSVPLGIFLDHINVGHATSWTYVQDEIFLVQFPELRAQVLDTIYTKEDFFSLFPKEIRPWDCLLLWGTAHSRSTLHIDPYNWTGTNAVIFGHKKWKLLPPGQDRHLSVFPGAGCGFPLECQKYNSKYDTYSTSDQIKRKLKKLSYLEVDQLSGEMLFLPTGWFHQAYNVVPTLALSGELMNRNNYLAVLEEIFHVGSLPRSMLPQNVETFTPERLVEFVMSRIPAKLLIHGAEWTKTIISNLYNFSNAVA